MKIIDMLLKEMDQEAQTTRKMLALVPFDKTDWKPHAKSMEMGRLAIHIAEIPGWVNMAIDTSELDFAVGDYKPTILKNTAELLECHEKNYGTGHDALSKTTEAELEKPWTMRNGETIYFTMTKAEVIRHAYSQIVHHRAQLGVYLRLLDIAIPGSYGPSADDQSM